jgi:hypothetical protein
MALLNGVRHLAGLWPINMPLLRSEALSRLDKNAYSSEVLLFDHTDWLSPISNDCNRR